MQRSPSLEARRKALSTAVISAVEFPPIKVETPPLDLSQVPVDAMAGVEVEQQVPEFWSKGALLNVRNRGDFYVLTLYPEEFDPRHPERALTFPNTWTCQDFVSRWYARENPDPRAR